MFERFLKAFAVGEPDPDISLADIDPANLGVEDVVSRLGGRAFGNGAYRIHSSEDVVKRTGMAERAFPQLRGRIACFGSDWLGRQFAAIRRGNQRIGAPILMCVVGTDEVLEVPADLAAFHDEVLVDQAEAALSMSFYDEWLTSGGRVPGCSECIGYVRPLFLGGSDEIENLEPQDFEVYWELSAQILDQTRGLPQGTPLRFTIGD